MTQPGSTFVEFSESDLLRNKLLTPGWYRLHIDKVNPWAPSNDQQSQNAIIETTVKFNADDASIEFAGVPIELLFNSKPKARTFLEGFLRALGVDVTAGRYDLAEVANNEVDAYIANDTYEGRVKNKPTNAYRKPRE